MLFFCENKLIFFISYINDVFDKLTLIKLYAFFVSRCVSRKKGRTNFKEGRIESNNTSKWEKVSISIDDMHHLTLYHGPNSRLVASD